MNKDQKRTIPTPVTPQESMKIESLGGEILVRGVTLLGRQKIIRAAQEEDKNGYSATAYMLSQCVLFPDGSCVRKEGGAEMTPFDWDIWAGANREDSEAVSEKCYIVTGFASGQAEKK